MSIWYDGTNLNLYRGDSGVLVFKGLPQTPNYRLYFSVKSMTTKEIIFEISEDPFVYYVDKDEECYVPKQGETKEEFKQRMQTLVREGTAFIRTRVIMEVPSSLTEKVSILKSQDKAEYYYGVKIIYTNDKTEDTLIPKVSYNPETKEPYFEEAPKFIVHQKYTEGPKSFLDYEVDYQANDVIIETPKDYGLQPLLAAGKDITIDANNVISASGSFNSHVELTNLKDNDLLVYSRSLDKWVNRSLDDLLQEEFKRQDDYMKDLKLTKVNDWLYSVEYTGETEYGYAKRYYDENCKPEIFACSSCRKGDFYGRNYDWYYDFKMPFVIKEAATENRHASIGIAYGLTALDKATVESGKYNTEYKILPYHTVDGINDCGLTCNINVTSLRDNPEDPLNEHPEIVNRTTGTNPEASEDVCVRMLPRLILDKASTVEEALTLINSWNIYGCFNEEDLEIHAMIADSTRTVIVEFVNNKVKVIEDWEKYKPIMTNFYITGWDGDLSNSIMQTCKEQGIEVNKTLTRHPNGLERYKKMYDGLDSVNSVEGMKALMDSIYYRKGCYSRTENPFWYSEMLGVYPFGEFTLDTDIDNPLLKIAIQKSIEEKEKEDRTGVRNGQTWQTVSQSVYDIANKTLTVTVQEDNSTTTTFTL